MLKLLRCLDSDDLAALRRRELDLPRDRARSLGWAAVSAIETGHYFTEDGEQVDIGHLVTGATNARVSMPPDAVLPSSHPPAFPETAVEVTNETTLGASRRLVERGLRPLPSTSRTA